METLDTPLLTFILGIVGAEELSNCAATCSAMRDIALRVLSDRKKAIVAMGRYACRAITRINDISTLALQKGERTHNLFAITLEEELVDFHSALVNSSMDSPRGWYISPLRSIVRIYVALALEYRSPDVALHNELIAMPGETTASCLVVYITGINIRLFLCLNVWKDLDSCVIIQMDDWTYCKSTGTSTFSENNTNYYWPGCRDVVRDHLGRRLATEMGLVSAGDPTAKSTD
jgi:hypothetical protein